MLWITFDRGAGVQGWGGYIYVVVKHFTKVFKRLPECTTNMRSLLYKKIIVIEGKVWGVCYYSIYLILQLVK